VCLDQFYDNLKQHSFKTGSSNNNNNKSFFVHKIQLKVLQGRHIKRKKTFYVLHMNHKVAYKAKNIKHKKLR